MALDRPDGFLPGAHSIDGYGAGGFRFGGMSHRGSILAVPTGVRAWSATTPDEIDAQSLALVFTPAAGPIEHLLIGTGVTMVPLPAALRDKLKRANIVGEPMATAAAARTYNILLGERRRVAVALIAVG